MKNKIKVGQILIDDCEIPYKVIDVLPNCAIISALKDIKGDIGCEIMTYKAMENEGWYIANIK